MAAPDPVLAPAERPRCPQHGYMSLRESYTPEQRFCGTWYRCTHQGPAPCGLTVLLISPGLQAQLDDQEKRLAQAAAEASRTDGVAKCATRQ